MPAMLRFPLEWSTVNKTEKQVGSCSRNSSDMSSSQPQSGNWYSGLAEHPATVSVSVQKKILRAGVTWSAHRVPRLRIS